MMPYEGIKHGAAIRGYIIRKNSEHRFCIAKTGGALKVRKGKPLKPPREARDQIRERSGKV